nr:hypothetical protein [Kibdelosporangium sp. MJ126-NF4]
MLLALLLQSPPCGTRGNLVMAAPSKVLESAFHGVGMVDTLCWKVVLCDSH